MIARLADVLMLGYHAVSPEWGWRFAVRPEALEQQLRRLLARGYRPTTFAGARYGTAGVRDLCVTFDDGFRSVMERGAPVLDRLGVPATLFVTSGFVDGEIDAPTAEPGGRGELAPLDWDGIRALAARGWEIGAHTVTHPVLTGLPDATLADELDGSRAAVEERIDAACTSFAYPYGDHDARVVAAVAEAGFVRAALFPPTRRDGGPLRRPRVAVLVGDDRRRFALKTSRAGRAVAATPLAPLARRLRRLS